MFARCGRIGPAAMETLKSDHSQDLNSSRTTASSGIDFTQLNCKSYPIAIRSG